LFGRYDAASDRIFSDEVFAAELEQIDYANAFLLGMDVGTIATDGRGREDIQQREALRFQEQLRAFRKGIEKSRGG